MSRNRHFFSTPGTVTVENTGLGGVTVALSGLSSATAVTDDNGQYAFTGLRMGSYSVEISGFDSDEIGFSNTASAVTVGVGESKIVSFDGTYLRTAGIQGRVSVEGEGLEGVTVSLSGGPDAVDETATTDASGQYSFARLRAGDYQVGISGYDTDDYEFEVTSQSVTVALGETATVPFEGVLLRTSGVSGRVSVEGMGLEGITVTLSMADADDMTAMTDAGGLYAFAGLAAGMYTVGIAVESDAYVFESMSMDVTVGDDETQIVNFEGMHARTASVSGMLFIDELMKNDMMDEGEAPLPHAGVPVVLVGPGVNDQVPSATDEMGAYSFTGLRAGDYQLVVPVTEPMGDFAYGGSSTGYALSVGVGEAVTQNLPIDITHTTVHFSVMLKSGEMMGAALPGAMVTLYADAMGETKAGEGTTMVNEETGQAVASIRVARAGTSGNTVHAAVAAEGYDVAGGKQAVMWDPQMTYTMAANANDIVNLNVDVTFGGATIMTEYGGGDALAGWAVGVMMGDDAVEGDDVPDMLDDEGMAAFMATVDSAGALPVTYTFAVAEDQDNKLDGGESYEGTDIEYTHTGLALAGTMDAGMIEVNYTTQSLVVGVHHERDQVMGYTGNVLDGDMRDDGMVDLSIRYIDGNGRSRSFTKKEWDAAKKTSTKDGVTTFSGLPADANVIVQASVADTLDLMLLDPDELAAYTGMEANGIMGGAFGDMGGFSHTVSLCPLKASNPQNFDECSSFAYVNTHTVSGLVWRKSVSKSGDDFKEKDPDFSDAVSISLTPVEGKNLAGEDQDFDALAKPSKEGKTDDHAFTFEDVAAGAYKVNVPAGWRVRTPQGDEETKGATGMLGSALSPLAGDLALDVTPATQTVYGTVRGTDKFGIDSVAVMVNNVTAMTDALGRYIAEGVSAVRGKVFISTSKAGYKSSAKPDSTTVTFAMNNVVRHDIPLSGVAKTATASGVVTVSGTGAPVSGVRIRVDGKDPINAGKNGLLTGTDGTFTATIPAKDLGLTSSLTASKAGYSFEPAGPNGYPVAAHAGANTPSVAFTGYLHATISGRVVAAGGGPMAGVVVTATPVAGDDAADADTTGVTGTYSLSVPFGNYDIAAAAANHTFEYPTTGQRVNVAPGARRSFGDIQARTLMAMNVMAVRQRTADDTTTENIDESERLDGQIRVRWSADTLALPDGYDAVAYTVSSNHTTDDFADASATVVGDSALARFASPADTSFMVRVVATATDTDGSGDGGATLAPIVINSASATVEAVDPSASNVEAARDTTNTDSISVSWNAVTNTSSSFRIVVQFSDGVWYVAGAGTTLDMNSRTWGLNASGLGATDAWTSVDGTGTKQAQAELAKAISVAVESLQGTFDADDNPWKRSDVKAVAAKPAS